MKKIVIAADSFKGSMSSETVCATIEKAFRNAIGDIETIKVPIADGGEGTVDALCQRNNIQSGNRDNIF